MKMWRISQVRICDLCSLESQQTKLSLKVINLESKQFTALECLVSSMLLLQVDTTKNYNKTRINETLFSLILIIRVNLIWMYFGISDLFSYFESLKLRCWLMTRGWHSLVLTNVYLGGNNSQCSPGAFLAPVISSKNPANRLTVS